MPELLLALDAGTTNLRVCLFSPGGDLLGQASAPVRSNSPAPGLLEQDALAIWTSTRRLIARALEAAGRSPRDLAAIGVTSQRTSAVLWDRATGKPVSPLVVWSDLRGAARARELHAAGFSMAAQQASAKLESMVAAAPTLPTGRLAFGNIDAWLIWKLTGGAAHVTDRSQGWPLGYMDMATLGWNTRLLDYQGLSPDMFPTLVDSWGEMGRTSARVLGAEVPICADIADQQSALIGQGCETAGQCKVTYGTSATLNASSGGHFLYPGPTTPPFILSHVAGETRFCLEGMVYSAGSALDWVRNSFRMGNHQAFEALARRAETSAGVHFLPALQGLGAPYGDNNRRGLVGGLNLANGPAEIALAGLEGIAFRIREIFDHIYGATSLTPPEVLRVDGGLTGNDTLMQIQADLLARPVARHAHREATACGAAMLAGRGAGLLTQTDGQGFVRHDRVFEPRLGPDEAESRLNTWKTQVYGVAA